MNESGAHLNLVLNQTGDETLVLEGWWHGVNREPLNLRNVGQGKPRLRALCILLLLVKYQKPPKRYHESKIRNRGDMVFQTKFARGTWIYTLGNCFDLAGWLETWFLIHDKDLFVSASPGSTENKTGTIPPSVTFDPKKLPLTNLHLFENSLHGSRKDAKPLEQEQLIHLARKIERKRKLWTESAIKELYPEFAYQEDIAKTSSGDGLRKIDKPDDALFLAFAEDVLRMKPGAKAPKTTGRVEECFQALLNREIETYRKECEPFFTFIVKMSGDATKPEPQHRPVWNQRQVSALTSNCRRYLDASGLQLFQFLRNEDFSKIKFLNLVFFDYSPHDISIRHFQDIDSVFVRLLKSSKSHIALDEFLKGDPTLVVPEYGKWEETFTWGAENSNRSIAFGALMAHQVTFVDFIEKLCLPILIQFNPFQGRGSMGDYASALNKETTLNKDLARAYCDQPKDFNYAWQTARDVLKAQADFWKALHRLLIALKN